MSKKDVDRLIVDIKLSGIEDLLLKAQEAHFDEVRDLYLNEAIKYIGDWQLDRMTREEIDKYCERYGK